MSIVLAGGFCSAYATKALVLSNRQVLLDLDELVLARAQADLLGMARHVKRFHDRGMNVLTPAARAHERSGGDYIGMGWPERLDVIA